MIWHNRPSYDVDTSNDALFLRYSSVKVGVDLTVNNIMAIKNDNIDSCSEIKCHEIVFLRNKCTP